MRFQRHRAITFGVALALSVYLGPISGSANTAASSDQVATLADAIAERFAPTQLSALIAVAAGRAQPGADDTAPSLEQLQRALDVDRDVAVALLRIFDQRDGEAERLIKDLAQSTVLYHAVTDDLSGMSLDEPDGQHIIVQAQAAMNAGRFGDAEVEIHQLENREVASADGSANGGAAPRSSEHRFTAAQARTLLGKIALMNLQYGKATEDFQLARQRLAMAPQEQPPVTDPKQVNASAVADASEPSSKISAAETDTNPDDQQQSTEATPPLPQLDLDWSQRIGPLMQQASSATPPPAGGSGGATITSVPVIMAMVPPAATTSTALREAPKPEAPPLAAAAVAQPPVATRGLPADTLELLLRRGDALLRLGDVASARLLYERAAQAGDARGAMGAGETYDPQFLSQMGARGIRADAAAAAEWYRKALALGDASAAGRLKLLSQASR
jgi:tetratricopeptide (TPR) repeat protein